MKFKDLDLGYKNNRNNNNSMGSTSDISSSNNTNTNNSTGSYTTARTWKHAENDYITNNMTNF